jgi:hypothetical protein
MPARLRALFSSNAILIVMPETAEEISQQPEVGKELQRATGEKRHEKVKAHGRDKLWFVTHALILAGCTVFYLLLGSKLIPLPHPTIDIAGRVLRGAALIVIVLAIAKAASVYGLGRIEDASTRFTLQRISHLVVALLIALIALSIIFVNWYAAVAAVGVGSIIIGLAVQTPMKSFIAWIYILVRQPYRVGDRIKIGDATGDVIDVGYLDTTLWEFGGQYISGDHPSGRLIKFPNEKVLDELGKEMMKRVEVFRQLLARTPIDELEVRSHPRVIFRVDEVTWINAIVRYLVSPREAGSVKKRLIPKLLAALNAEPDKVMFPAGANR